MSELRRPSEILLSDPLAKVTRAERKLLLGVSAFGIVVVKTGLVPSKIAALGIEFAETNRAALLKSVAAVICYFLAAFAIYATSDFLAWRFSIQFAVRDWQKRRALLSEEERRAEDQAVDNYLRRDAVWSNLWRRLNQPVSALRAFFDFLLPVLVAAYAIALLVTTAPPREIPPKTPPPPKHSILQRPSPPQTRCSLYAA